MKKCGRCKEEKSDENFYKRKDSKTLTCYCKDCLRKNSLIRMNIFKEQCVEYKGGKCEMCGYNYSNAALDFHHIDPNEKEFAIAESKVLDFNKHYVKITKELDKCILLCSNCHREIHEEYTTKELLEDKEHYLKLRQECIPDKKNNLLCSCGKPKSYKSIVCMDCRKKEIEPKRDINAVISSIKELGFVKAGKKFGVSDNALRKYLIRRGYNIKNL